MYFYVNTWPNTELLIPWSVIPKYHNYKFQEFTSTFHLAMWITSTMWEHSSHLQKEYNLRGITVKMSMDTPNQDSSPKIKLLV